MNKMNRPKYYSREKMISLTDEWYDIQSSGNDTLTILLHPINCIKKH